MYMYREGTSVSGQSLELSNIMFENNYTIPSLKIYSSWPWLNVDLLMDFPEQ